MVRSVVRKADVESLLTRVNSPHDQLSTKFTLPDSVVMNLPLSINEDLSAYIDRYPWIVEWEDVRWDARDNRLVHIIKDHKGNIVDAIGRAVNPRKGQPKTKVYGKGEYPLLAQSEDAKGNLMPAECYKDMAVVVVEDINSALRLNSDANIDACAINGTYMRDSFVPHLTQYGQCIIILDSDAVSKAAKMKSQMEQYIPTCFFPLDDNDIKDMGKEQFIGLVSSILQLQGE